MIEFSNTNIKIQKRFKYLMKKVFNYPVKFYKNGNLKINRINVIKNLRSYTRFGSHRWKVPKQILYSKNEKIKSRFCRAFFDGDGTIEAKKKEIRLDSINNVGLKQIRKLLYDLGIKSKFYKFSDRFRLVINDINKFYNKIGFFHPQKEKKLKTIVSSK